MKKYFFRNFTKLTGKHLCQSLFRVNFAKFLRALFLQNTYGRLLFLFLKKCPCHYILILCSFQHVILETHRSMHKNQSCLFTYICCQLSVSPNNSARICPTNLNICMFYHMINSFRNTVFYISFAVPLINKEKRS